jgi:hypothetical protein
VTTGNSVYLIWNKDVRQMWAVSRECLLLRGTWSYLWCFRGPCKPDFHCGLFHVPDLGLVLTPDFSVYLDFDCGLFRSPNLDTLNLTTGIWIWNRVHGWCDRSAEGAHSSVAPDSTFAFCRGSVLLYTKFCNCLLVYYYVLHIDKLAILYVFQLNSRIYTILVNFQVSYDFL